MLFLSMPRLEMKRLRRKRDDITRWPISEPDFDASSLLLTAIQLLVSFPGLQPMKKIVNGQLLNHSSVLTAS